MRIYLESLLSARHSKTVRSQRGFTLIELVIVLAVLGALAAIAVPQLTGLQDEAELAGTATVVSSEAGNLFAQALANGETNGNWTDGNACTRVSNNAAALSDGGFGLQPGEPQSGEYREVTVPTYESSDATVGQTSCYLTLN